MKLKALITLLCGILYTNSCLAQPTTITQYLFNGNPRRIPDSASGLTTSGSGLNISNLVTQNSNPVAKDSSNHVESVIGNGLNTVIATNFIIVQAQPTMIQGEIDYVVRTNWIDESVTRKLPENAAEYTMHQVGQVVTNIEARFVFDGQLHIVNLGIKLATNVYRRDRVFSKRMQIDTPPVPGVMNTNNYGTNNPIIYTGQGITNATYGNTLELPYSQRTYRIP